MKKIALLLLINPNLLNAMEVKTEQDVAQEEKQETVGISKATQVWHLLDHEGIPDLKFIAALAQTNQNEDAINRADIPEELKTYLLDLKQELGAALLNLLKEQVDPSPVDVDKAKLIINAGASLDNQDETGTTTLIFAISNNWPNEIVKLLLADPDLLDRQNDQGLTGLMVAASLKSIIAIAFPIPEQIELLRGINEKAQMLINAGANVNARANNKDTALILAAGANDKDMVELLIKARAKLDKKNNDGITALIAAHDKDVVDSLIKAGADLDVQDNYGNSALSNAAKQGNKEKAELLIKAGANVNLQDSSESTALIYALENDDNDIAKQLIQAGAQAYLINGNNQTAMDIAYERDNQEILNILEAL